MLSDDTVKVISRVPTTSAESARNATHQHGTAPQRGAVYSYHRRIAVLENALLAYTGSDTSKTFLQAAKTLCAK